MISSRTAPFLLSTVGTDMQGYRMEMVWVDKSNTSFLSFHKTHAILQPLYIFHSKVPCGTFLNALLLFNISGNPTHFNQTAGLSRR